MALITDKYIYIHPYKTGGNSVRQILGHFDNKHEVGGVHVEAKYIRAFCESNDDIGEGLTAGTDNWNDAFKFSFVRNPYDWNASLYYYIRGSTAHNMHSKAQGSYLDFLKWLTEEAMHFDKAAESNKYLTLTEFLYDEDELLVDYVGNLESFNKDMKYICDKVGHIYRPVHANRTGGRKSWLDITDTACKKIIDAVFHKDFENFGYSM